MHIENVQRTWLIIAACAALVLCLFAPPAKGAPTQNEPGDDREAISRIDSGVSDAVWRALNILDQSGSTLFPDLYGGKTLGLAGSPDHIIVFLTNRNEPAERAIRGLLGLNDDQLTFRFSDTTWSGLLGLTEEIQDDLPGLITEGFAVHGAGINGNMRPYFITDATITLAEIDLLEARYGNQVDFLNDGPAITESSGRANDSAPWYGGAFMASGSGGCTAGFAVRWAATGNNYMLTAGHCYALTQNVYNGIAPPVSIGGYNSTLYGSVTNRTYGNGGLDAELIYANGGGRIWAGSTSTSSSIPVDAIASTYTVGQPVCAGGAYEGESCGNTVSGINICIVIQGNSSCGLDYVTSSNPQAVGSGDSGGPVYASVGGTVYAFGTIKATATEGPCSNWSSYYGASAPRQCGRNWYFTELDQIANQWNLVLDN